MALGFKLYGDFHWPPISGPTPAGPPSIEQGVIEIYFVPQTGVPTHRPLLRWIPRARVDDTPLPEPLPDIPALFSLVPDDLGANGLMKWFNDNRDTGGMLWLGKSTPGPIPDRSFVIFRGGFLFEQYALDGADGAKGGLQVQWPLVAQTAYLPDQPVYSVLGLCHKAKPFLYFNFHLPLPVRRSSLMGSTPENAAFFPFSAAYDLTPATAEKLIEVDKLFGGWQKDDLLPEPDADQYPCFAFDSDNYPPTPRLGFDFAEFGQASGTNFAVFNLAKPRNHRYWPLNKKAVLQDILWRYGFELKHDDTDWLDATNLGIADSSLRFPPIAVGASRNRGNRSAIIYRATVERNGSAPAGSDLQTIGGSGLRLRLRDELGGRRADRTQFGAGESFDDEKRFEIEGWLRVGRTLSVDCELAWEIAAADIWSRDRTADWSPTVTVRMHWRERIAPDDVTAAPAEPQPAGASAQHDFKAGLLAQANFSFGAARAALEPGEAGRPHSFLPTLSAASAQEVRFTLYGSPLPAEFKDDRIITWGRAAPTNNDPSPPWRRPPMRLTLASAAHVIPAPVETTKTLRLRANDMTFFQAGGALDLRLEHDQSWPPASADTIEDEDPLFASFALKTLPRENWRGRLASLQFAGLGQETVVNDSRQPLGHMRVGGRGARLGLGRGSPILAYPDGRVATELRLPIAAAKVEPVGVDVARADRSGRPGPLLIPLDATSGGTPTANLLWLTATETLSPTHDRLLEAIVTENSQETGERTYVVLASEPYSIFRFTHQPLHARGQADAATVAFYSGDDRLWQYRRVSDFYHYVLPPQSIGESADKPRRLEIHDLEPDVSLATPPRPFAPDLDKDGNERGRKRRVVEYRLTPSAEIWIRPSDVERGYFMPESTSHEIFRQPGQLGLGAALGYLRAEFLYGLSVGVDVGKERSIARGARVAEIEALTGRLTGPVRETDAEARLTHRWNAVRSAVARRPERLEVWARDLDSAIDFTPARFSDGVQFALRHTALHRAPLIDPTPEKDEGLTESRNDFTSPPRVGGLLPSQVPAALEANPRHHPQGLSGGALWPVESLNLFRSLLKSPQSRGGAIESIALSPIGGDATQKAEFLGGKVTIISDTRNGRVERLQVEVLGRICALWHRAKHVVVYERTVNPSAQFAPKFDEDKKRTRSRRPILRKVREYIELLQPERSYPDFSTAAQRSAGFLERVRFNSKIINVDSAWASDVGTYGWQIPLWNRLSARERPQVYPMPDIAFVSSAEGDGEKPVVAQECLDPDYLFFFADVSPDTTADTDTWVSRLNLDFPNMPVSKVISDETDKSSSSDPGDQDRRTERRRPPVGRILPGLRRFTWRLALASQKTAINAGRAGKPVYVGLESVSFMRATHSESKHTKLDDIAVLKNAAAAKSKISGKDNAALAALKYWDREGNSTAFEGAKAFSKNIGDLAEALDPKKKDLNALNAARLKLADQWKGDFKTKLKGLIPGDLQKDLSNLKSGLKGGPALCAKLKTDAVETIQRKEMLIRAEIQDWIAQAEDFVTEAVLFAKGATKANAISELQTRAVQYIRPLFAEASKDIGKVEEGVEKSKAALIDLEVEAEAVINRSRQRITQVVDGYDNSKPWSLERRTALRAGLRACVRSIEGDILAAIEETRQRLGVELNEVSQGIAGHLSKAIKVIAVTEADVIEKVESLHGAADRLYFRVDKALARIEASDAAGEIDGLITKVDASTTIPGGLKTTVMDALKALKDKHKAAKSNVADARNHAADFDRLADEGAANLKTEATQLGTALKSVLTDAATPAQDLIASIQGLKDANAADIAAAVTNLGADLKTEVDAIANWSDAWLQAIGTPIDAVVLPATKFLDDLLLRILTKLREIPAAMVPIIDDATQALKVAQDLLAPENLLEKIVAEKVVGGALDVLLKPLPDSIIDVAEALLLIKQRLALLNETMADRIRELQAGALDTLGDVTQACNAVFEGVKQVEDYINELAKPLTDVQAYFETQLNNAYTALEKQLGKLDQALGTFPEDAAGLITAAKSFDQSVRGLQNNLSRAYESANVYADRVFDQVAKLGEGGILAAPSNILKLYSAVTSAPEIAALKADIDRIRSGFDELSDIIETTKANALFNRLGDELKALGLSLPFDKISDRLLPADLTNFDIGKVFRNFGGSKLDNLLKGYKLPAGVRDAVRVTHDFDKKQARAWVQVDIDAPMPGRRSLFSVGVFKADFVDMRLTGQVRLEASKDTDKVTETGFGRVGTVIDLVVGGQSMVRFEKFGLNFTKEKGLDVEFDPKNIRLNPSFKYIQDFLSTLFPDEIGGLQVIKENGIPVGVQHDFAIPPISLNFATSGVSNISISNHFKLLAYPDFMLANRFNLSTVERPFIFSIFIIGGTGYIQIDAEYRPFDSELMVAVEAGAGGSASLAFAFGPFVGQVFITLSGALTYRKVIGKPGGGLSISAILVIAGHVDVAGIITVGIVLMLRMTYRDNGQIDADGSLTVTIRISKFFKITARANVKYKMRGGKSETAVTTDTSTEITDKNLKDKVDKVNAAAKKLEQARN